MLQKRFLLMIFLASTLIAGCAGTSFKWSDARKIKAGMTTDEVTQLLGEPNGIVSRDGVLIYSWSSVSLSSGSRAIRIEFKDNKVTDTPAVPNSFKD